MKKTLICVLLALLAFSTYSLAQTKGSEWMKSGQEALSKKEYVKARYAFLQAFNAFAAQNQYAPATRCGLQACALYHRENLYKEAFDLLRNVDQVITSGEKQSRKSLSTERYLVTKERLQMYIKLKNPARAKEQLGRLEERAKATANDSIANDYLFTQANYCYTFGMTAQGDKAIEQLIGQYNAAKDYDKVRTCYQTLIGIGRKANNAALTARTYESYMQWNDSVRALTAQADVNALQQKYDASLSTIDEKDSALRTKQYIIVGLCILAAILAGALIFGGIVLLRFIMLTRKQKKAIDTANEHNELKTAFIHNISAQMEPTLNTLDAKQPGVQALQRFATHIQQLSDLENSLTEPYEVKETNVATFCDEVMASIKGLEKSGVTLTINAPKLGVKINEEALRFVLIHLLKNAAEYTPAEGKIWLDFKKRGAHTHQFIVSDTGCGIAEDKQEHLFKPFSEIKDLTNGDGLGLPICALMATKMNGELTLDTTYTKGARFILELHN